MKKQRPLTEVIDDVRNVVTNLDICRATKIKVQDSNANLIFCNKDRQSLFSHIGCDKRTQEFKDLRLKFLNEYESIWKTCAKDLYKELGEILNEKHSLDINAVINSSEHESESSDDGIPF